MGSLLPNGFARSILPSMWFSLRESLRRPSRQPISATKVRWKSLIIRRRWCAELIFFGSDAEPRRRHRESHSWRNNTPTRLVRSIRILGCSGAMLSAMASQEEATRQRAVLVVEDEILIRSAVAEFLRNLGYRVIEAADAAEAVAIFASRTQIDLVFSDINMPGPMDGIGLVRWIADHHPGTHIILTSAISHAPRAGQSGAGFLRKPYRLAEAARPIAPLLNDPPQEET